MDRCLNCGLVPQNPSTEQPSVRRVSVPVLPWLVPSNVSLLLFVCYVCSVKAVIVRVVVIAEGAKGCLPEILASAVGVGCFIGDVVDSIFGSGSDSTQYDTLTDEDNDGIPDLYEQDLDSSDVLRGIVHYLNDLGENYKFNKIREEHPRLSSTDRIRYKAGIRTDPPYVSDAGYEVFMKGDVWIVSGDLRLVGDLHFGQTYNDTGLARTFSGGSTLSTVLNGKENALTFSSDFTRT